MRSWWTASDGAGLVAGRYGATLPPPAPSPPEADTEAEA
jgi:hypothetical protein